jgi:hypothetical protein
MRQHSSVSLLAAVIAILVWTPMVLAPVAGAQAPTLQEQLLAQYKLVKMGSDSSGAAVVEKGTLLAIKKGGILGVPSSDSNTLSTRYQDGTVHSPSSLLSKGIGLGMKRFGKEQTTRLFQVGEKVYPSKVEVKVDKDAVNLNIVACDTCNKTDPPTYYKATVVFQFAKGSLAKASAGEVEDTIGQLLAVTEEDSEQDKGQQDQGQQGQQGGGQGGQGGGQGGQGGQAGQNGQGGQGGQDQQQSEPQTIEKGMTPDEVQNALGKPDKIVNLGTKQLYIYKDMKITFVNGKVSDVQ